MQVLKPFKIICLINSKSRYYHIVGIEGFKNGGVNLHGS